MLLGALWWFVCSCCCNDIIYIEKTKSICINLSFFIASQMVWVRVILAVYLFVCIRLSKYLMEKKVSLFSRFREERESNAWASWNILIAWNAQADLAYGDEVSETMQGGFREEAEVLLRPHRLPADSQGVTGSVGWSDGQKEWAMILAETF